MNETGRNKWSKRFCKWIASLLTITLLVNQSHFSVLAEEIPMDVKDIVTDGENYDSDVYEDVRVDADTDINTESGTDINTESSTDTNTESGADTDTESDMDAEDEGKVSFQDDEVENVVEDDTVSPAAVGDTFTDNEIIYRIIGDEENALQVEVAGHEEGTSVSGDLMIPSAAFDGDKEYAVVLLERVLFMNVVI